MNGRLYDPQLGRMLSPDPVVITNASLNFNSYSYVNNNPLKYTDPSGEIAPLIVIAAIASAALVGGALNLVSAALSGKIKNIGDAFAYFGAGAIGGAVAVFNPAIGFGVTAALNVGADFATGNAYNVRGDASSGVNFLTLGFSVLDGFNAVSGGQIGQIVFKKLLEKSTRPVLTLAAKELTQLPTEQLAKQTASTGIKGVEITAKEIAEETIEQSLKKGGQVVSDVLPKASSQSELVFKTIDIAEDIVVHGNSLKSLRPTWGYKLYTNSGVFLKNGITSKLIPQTRFSKAFMNEHYMELVPQFPNRLSAYKWEYLQNIINRGPKNFNMH